MSRIIKQISYGLSSLLGTDHVTYNDIVLPPKGSRFCGEEFNNDEYYLASARKEAERLITFCGLTPASRVLDVGCGQGRLSIGILSCVGEIEHYRGIDVNRRSVRWCQRYRSRRHPTFQFIHMNVKNLRYNPKGNEIDDSSRFPFRDREFDIIYLYSVFSHMTERDVGVYVKEFRRLLNPTGKVFLTAFVEEGVPEVTVNPDNYRKEWKGTPLHCVRYERGFFHSLLDSCGFHIERFDYATETNGQSAIYLSPKNHG